MEEREHHSDHSEHSELSSSHSEHSEHGMTHSEHHEHHKHHEHGTSHSEDNSSKRKPSRWQRWRKSRKRHRAARREYYRHAPWIVRAWKFWLKKLIIVLFIMTLAVIALFESGMFDRLVGYYIDRMKDDPVSMETIYSMAPPDTEGEERIDAMEPYTEDETWTVCVYMIGSSLEDKGKDDLSVLTRMTTEQAAEKNREQSEKQTRKKLTDFTGELESKGLAMPAYLYEAEKSAVLSASAAGNAASSEENGAASGEIKEITSGVWGDNITVVIQTGGAAHWTNSAINPNKTQRFEYKSGVFSEVAELPLQDSCAPETLSDFMRFCDSEYPADHKMLILWNHGGGVEGFGRDSIFGTTLSLKDLKSAFSAVYKPGSGDMPFDIIGFDAGLMATAELACSLDGFGKYMVASEELEPDFGWSYNVWLQKMTDDPTMNAAQISRTIVDSYIDYAMTLNKNTGNLTPRNEVTLSVVDIHQAAKAYDAYGELCAAQLRDAAEDLRTLADIGRKAGSITRFGGCWYDEVNSVDFDEYMQLLEYTYPKEARKVRAELDDAVLYHRHSKELSDTQGLSVYVPVETNDLEGLLSCLSFIDDVCENRYVSALYYYKTAGCLNDRMSKYTALTDQEPEVLDTDLFKEIGEAVPVIESNNWSIPAENMLLDMIQGCSLELSLYDDETESLTCYGRDGLVQPEGGSFVSGFDGRWIALDNVPLAVEIVSSSASAVLYRSKVTVDGENYYLMFAHDRDSGEFYITELRKAKEGTGSVLMPDSRKTETALIGKTLSPVYETRDLRSGMKTETSGKKIHITPVSKIGSVPLTDGTYLSTVVITDPRGDVYRSAAIEQKLMNSKIIISKISAY